MQRLFQTLCVDVFGLSKAAARKLWKDARSPVKARPVYRVHNRRNPMGGRFSAPAPFRVDYVSVDEPAEWDEALAADGTIDIPSGQRSHGQGRRARQRSIDDERLEPRAPLRGGPARPLATHLHCRGRLHDAAKKPALALLNTPLYIATDSHHPVNDPHLAAFFRWFPCTFVLGDFARAGRVNERPIEALAQLASRESDQDTSVSKWTSDWDGSNLGNFLLPFLEAEVRFSGSIDIEQSPADAEKLAPCRLPPELSAFSVHINRLSAATRRRSSTTTTSSAGWSPPGNTSDCVIEGSLRLHR